MVVRTKKIYLEPKGIKNIGNTCFFNSAIQCLLSISEFITFYKENVFEYSMPISRAFSEFIEDYEKSKIVSPNKFLNGLKAKFGLFDGSQQDSHEFVIRFLEVLHDELPTKHKVFTSKVEFLEHCSENIISKLFYSFNKQTILCPKCGFKSDSFVLLNMMQIDVKETTQRGLSQIFESEKIDGNNVWKCESCAHTKSAVKNLEVIIYPHILILYIKRFNSMSYKNNNNIKIDEKIKFGESHYFFNGVVCHSGNLNEGHYYSSAKRSGKWISYNDSLISIGIGNYGGNNPYLHKFMNIDNYNEAIVITSLELIKFMCHEHLVVEFTKPFTCIGGRNGSGKSAIMIALGILFGQRSSTLDRGSSYKNLIKTGEQFFIIKCVMNNTKKYCYDFFGDYIILEKRVTYKSSGFSILNKNKKIHSNKIEDLEYLLDVFNIKLENPLNYLTQEQSKRFLSSADPTYLYKLFLKGTEIADIKLINNKYETNITALRNKIANIENHIAKIDKDLESESKKFKILANIDKYLTLIKQDEDELKWSAINLINEDIKILEGEIENLDFCIKEEQQVNTQLLEKAESLRSQKKFISEQMQNILITNKEKIAIIDEKIMKLDKKVRSMENDKKDMQDSCNIKKDLLNRLGKCNTVNDEQETLRARKNDIEFKLQEARSQLEHFNLILIKEKKFKDEQDIENEKFKKKIYALQKQIGFCNSIDEKNDIHSEMNKIRQIIIKSNNFKDKVIGPIADFISLKNQKWWKVASIVLQKILTSFICLNSEDRDTLVQIFKNNNVQFRILVPSNKSENILKYEKNLNFNVLLDVLEFKSNIVLNQLIILENIESKALIENRSEAYKFIKTNPKNIECIFTLAGDIIKKMGGSITDFAPRKLEKYYFEKPKDTQKSKQEELNLLLKTKPNMKCFPRFEKASKDYEDCFKNINLLERNLADLSRQIESVEEFFSAQQEITNNEEISESYHNLENQINLLTRKIDNINNELNTLSLEKDDINNTQYPSINNIDINIHKLEVKTNICTDNIQKYIQKKIILNKKLQDRTIEYNNARTKLLIEIPEILNTRSSDVICNEISQLKIKIEEAKNVGNKKDTENLINEILEKKRINERILNLNKYKVEDVYKAFQQRIIKRDEIKEFVAANASVRFKELTLSRGYKGDLEFDHKEEKLYLKMEVHNFGIAGNKETLSGGEKSFAAMSLLFSLWPHITCPLKVLDEFDVFMDDLNRKYIIQKFIEYFKKSDNQVILITPLNTKDLEDEEVQIITLNPPRETSELLKIST